MNASPEEHFVGKIAQKAIVEQDGKLLLIQDPREEVDIWELPGGRLNVEEEPRAALQREFYEEMGVAIDVHDVVHMQQFVHGGDNARAFVIVYRATLQDAAAPFVLSEQEIAKVGWFSESEIQKLTLFPEYAAAVEAYFASKYYQL